MCEVEELLLEEKNYNDHPEHFCEICKDHFHFDSTNLIDIRINKKGSGGEAFTCSHDLKNMDFSSSNVDRVRVTLPCGHHYHYECISNHIFYSKSRQCPYCRQECDYIPLLPGQDVVKNVHREYFTQDRCCVILKSGKKKGEMCGSKTYGDYTTCLRHANKKTQANKT